MEEVRATRPSLPKNAAVRRRRARSSIPFTTTARIANGTTAKARGNRGSRVNRATIVRADRVLRCKRRRG